MTDWEERAASARARYEDGAARLPDDGDERQRQLTRMGNAAWAAGLALLMLGRREEARGVADPCGRDVSRELAGRAAGKLGSADRRDEVAADRR